MLRRRNRSRLDGGKGTSWTYGKSDERGWRKKMTIDEAIKHAKEVANNYGDYREVQREIK